MAPATRPKVRYPIMSDEQNKPAEAPGISLLPDVLTMAQTMAQPTAEGAAPAKPKKTKAKAKAKPQEPTVWASIPEAINLGAENKPPVAPVNPTPVAVSVSQGGTVAVTGVGGQTIPMLVAGGVYPIALPPALHARLRKEVTGVGGWQTLMGQLRECTMPDMGVLMLPHDLMLTMIPKAVVHGSGGYQGVIRWILCLLLEQHKGAILAPATK